jgi:hypothetical protein
MTTLRYIGVAPPVPDIDIAHHRGRFRIGHAAKLVIDGGAVIYYPSKTCFEARCSRHANCVMTKGITGVILASGSGDVPVPVGGRPVGFLMAWLAAGVDLATKEEHWHRALFASLDQGFRMLGRMEASHCETGALLLSYERELAHGEDEEAPTLDGLLPHDRFIVDE